MTENNEMSNQKTTVEMTDKNNCKKKKMKTALFKNFQNESVTYYEILQIRF